MDLERGVTIDVTGIANSPCTTIAPSSALESVRVDASLRRAPYNYSTRVHSVEEKLEPMDTETVVFHSNPVDDQISADVISVAKPIGLSLSNSQLDPDGLCNNSLEQQASTEPPSRHSAPLFSKIGKAERAKYKIISDQFSSLLLVATVAIAAIISSMSLMYDVLEGSKDIDSDSPTTGPNSRYSTMFFLSFLAFSFAFVTASVALGNSTMTAFIAVEARHGLIVPGYWSRLALCFLALYACIITVTVSYVLTFLSYVGHGKASFILAVTTFGLFIMTTDIYITLAHFVKIKRKGTNARSDIGSGNSTTPPTSTDHPLFHAALSKVLPSGWYVGI